jgi:energy-coupling factor transport system permease protein
MTTDPRWLHPGAWWLWAIGLAAAATRTTNPLLLAALIGAAAVVVGARRPNAPWARCFVVLLVLGGAVVAIRVVTQLLLGTGSQGPLLFTLPEATLPAFLAGVSLGGPAYLGDLAYGLSDGLRLATLMICLGAASSLASPSRMLKAVPAALYELGVAIVVALTFTPQLVSDILRVRNAQRLRGRNASGLRGWWASAVPVVNGSLERSVALAAAMDSRGYGRQAEVPRSVRLVTTGLLLIGMAGVILGLYGMLSGGEAAQFGPPITIIGVSVAVVGLVLAGKRQIRTQYRPDPFALPEWLVAGSGAAVAVCFIVVASDPSSAAHWQMATTSLPAWAPLAVGACLVACLPAVVAPELPPAVRR